MRDENSFDDYDDDATPSSSSRYSRRKHRYRNVFSSRVEESNTTDIFRGGSQPYEPPRIAEEEEEEEEEISLLSSPLPNSSSSSKPVTVTITTTTTRKKQTQNRSRKKASPQSEENKKKRMKVFDPAETLNSDAHKDLGEIHFSTMMVTTPKKKTTIQTIQTTNGQLSHGVAKKHVASPRKTPRKKKKNRRSDDPKTSTLEAMIESFQSVSLSWHDIRSVDLRMLRTRRR